MRGVARALDAAHACGIVHRDVKPSNIRIRPDDRAALLDFGVARDLDAAAPTLTADLVGSPYYLAPEQIGRAGRDVDPRADVYGLGVVLYECITGRVPYDRGSLEQVLHDIIAVTPPAPRTLDR